MWARFAARFPRRRHPQRHLSGLASMNSIMQRLAFTGFAGKDVLEKHAQSQAADSASALIEIAPLISGLVHELQKERGSSVGFVSSKGQTLGDTMRNQR